MSLSACINEDTPPQKAGSLTVSIASRSDANAAQDEMMRRVRIIIARAGATSEAGVLYDETFTNLTDKESFTRTYGDLTNGTYDVYAIVNQPAEASANVIPTYSSIELKTDPDSYVTGDGIPMTGKTTVTLSGKDEAVTLPVVRAVSKVNLVFDNTRKDDFTISSFTFGRFRPDKTWWWVDAADSQQGDAVPGATYSGLSVTEPITIKSGERYVFPTFYVYESKGLGDAYALTIVNAANPTDPFVLRLTDKDGQKMDCLRRNTCVNITVSIAKMSEIYLTYEVRPWDNRTVDVPDFQ